MQGMDPCAQVGGNPSSAEPGFPDGLFGRSHQGNGGHSPHVIGASVLDVGFREDEHIRGFTGPRAKQTMKADLELILVHDGRHWVVHNDNLVAKGEEFEALDADLKRVLLESSTFLPGERVTVFMGFDFDTIPTWLRQYHTHYFNRFVTVDL
jgi:hypothetical protein